MARNKSKKKSTQPPSENDQNQETVSQPETRPAIRISRAPFNRPEDGTIGVLTEDGTTFFVEKGILTLASQNLKERIFARSILTDSTSLSVPCKSYTFDAILRFLYPIRSPVFKDMSECASPSTLPFCMMAPIYADAKTLGIDVVCNTIVDAAKELASSRLIPRSGEVAVRVYAFACALNLDYEHKLNAARAVLHVPLDIDIHQALRSDRVSTEEIQALQDFHARAFEAIHDLLRVGKEDGCAEGLPDLYASFVSCAQCSQSVTVSENPMRVGSAMWWQDYVRRSIEVLRYAPLNPVIFGEAFVNEMFQKAKECRSCQVVVHRKWCQIMPFLLREIPYRVGQMELTVPVSQCEEVSVAAEAEEESTAVTTSDSDEDKADNVPPTPTLTRRQSEPDMSEAPKFSLESTFQDFDRAVDQALARRNISNAEASLDDIFSALAGIHVG